MTKTTSEKATTINEKPLKIEVKAKEVQAKKRKALGEKNVYESKPSRMEKQSATVKEDGIVSRKTTIGIKPTTNKAASLKEKVVVENNIRKVTRVKSEVRVDKENQVISEIKEEVSEENQIVSTSSDSFVSAAEEIPEIKKENIIEMPKKLKGEVLGWDDLDCEDKFDPVMVSEYVSDIFDYLKDLETKIMPDPNYMLRQRELEWRMRTILIDWLVEVHHKFRLLPETLFFAVNIIDRLLSIKPCNVNKLQLVGITAMFIASKFEEVYAPTVAQFSYMIDGHKPDEIITAEMYILVSLDFQLAYPNPLNFLRRCSKADNYDIQSRTLAKYFLEVTLLDEVFLNTPPSVLAASSLFLAKHMLGNGEWVRFFYDYRPQIWFIILGTLPQN
jgi:hypothetical protein